jgi:DNA-binding MarR family transcriptional regulator
MSHEAAGSEFVIKNALLASKLSKRVGNRLGAHGISLSEFLVMHYLYNSPIQAVSRIELADYVNMSASGITRLMAPLEKNRVIDKEVNPRDARQSLVKLSKTGWRLYEEAVASFEHIAGELVAGLSQAELSKILALYAKVI